MTQQLGGERDRIQVKIDNLTQARKCLDELIRRAAELLAPIGAPQGGRIAEENHRRAHQP
jgi:hypothetical protein